MPTIGQTGCAALTRWTIPDVPPRWSAPLTTAARLGAHLGVDSVALVAVAAQTLVGGAVLARGSLQVAWMTSADGRWRRDALGSSPLEGGIRTALEEGLGALNVRVARRLDAFEPVTHRGLDALLQIRARLDAP